MTLKAKFSQYLRCHFVKLLQLILIVLNFNGDFMGMHPVNQVDNHDIFWHLLFGDDREKMLEKMCDLELLDVSLLDEWRKFLDPISPKSRAWANLIDKIFFKTSALLESNSYLSSRSPRDIVSNFIKASSIFGENFNYFENLRGKTFLDLGSGIYRSLNVSMIMYCNGVDKAYAFEPYPLQIDFVYHSFQKMLESMSNSPEDYIYSDISIDEFMGRIKTFMVPYLYSKIKKINNTSDGILNIGGLTFFRNLRDVPRNSVNIHFSNAVLEHIVDISSLLSDLARVVTPDSVGIHVVDFLDHRHYNDSAISPVEKYFDNFLDEINGYTPSEMEKIFVSSKWVFNKFEALKIPREYIVDDVRDMVSRYSSHSLHDLMQHINFYKLKTA